MSVILSARAVGGVPSALKTDHGLTGAGLFVFNLVSFMVDARRLCLSGDVEVITEMWRETGVLGTFLF